MKEFSFFIPAENYSYTFSLPSKMMGTEVYVETSGLRHPEFYAKNNAISSILQHAIAKEEMWQSYDEFQNDLKLFVNKIISYNIEITHELLNQVLLSICKDHINKCGRLLFFDLLGYADLATFVDKAIYSGTVESYHSFYRYSVYNVMNTFPQNVLYQNPLGGFYSWSDVSQK